MSPAEFDRALKGRVQAVERENHRTDLQTAILAATIANMSGKTLPEGHEVSYTDFMPKSAAEVAAEPTLEERKAALGKLVRDREAYERRMFPHLFND